MSLDYLNTFMVAFLVTSGSPYTCMHCMTLLKQKYNVLHTYNSGKSNIKRCEKRHYPKSANTWETSKTMLTRSNLMVKYDDVEISWSTTATELKTYSKESRTSINVLIPIGQSLYKTAQKIISKWWKVDYFPLSCISERLARTMQINVA
ncbi:conserved hypothetical protein [Trichinella spiralis]|uniref:hypothetical protein n=1 Tax=Trichinella spiralis TaxID=6334 RepID=UPI0001EFB780|nr:conserved hypothetical protein [Trichinella spiralis]